MITRKLTSKAQTTILQAVRTALGLRAGDELAYIVEDGCAVLRRCDPRAPLRDPIAIFSEWASIADAEAYGDL